MDESLWGEQDEPQEPKQEANNKVLQDLRPNVVRSTPTSRTLKAKAGAWGASKLIKPAKETVNVATYTAAEWADSTARAAVAAKTKWRDVQRRQVAKLERYRMDVPESTRRQASVSSPSPPPGQPPKRTRRKRRESRAAHVFSSDEDDDEDDEEDESPINQPNRHRRAKPASRPQTRDIPNKKATLLSSGNAVVDQLPQEEDDEDDDSDYDDDDDDNDDPSIVPADRRRRAQPSRSKDSPNQNATSSLPAKALVYELSQGEDDDGDDDEDGDPPIVHTNRRRRAQPAPPSQPKDNQDQPTTPPLSSASKAAAGRLLQTSKTYPRLSQTTPLSTSSCNSELLRLASLAQPYPWQASPMALPSHFPRPQA
jgi:hypothetical protein